MTRASSGSIVAYGKFYQHHISAKRAEYGCIGIRTAGLPREHFVMAWNKVDLPTLASPTYQPSFMRQSLLIRKARTIIYPTYDARLERIARSPQKYLFLFYLLLWRHLGSAAGKTARINVEYREIRGRKKFKHGACR